MKNWIIIIVAVLICIIIFADFLRYEYGYFEYEYIVVSADKQEICSELPELQITEEEKELYTTIFEIPVIKEKLYGQEYVHISYDDILTDVEHIIPPHAEVTDVFAGYHVVYIYYTVRETEIALCFTSPESNPLIIKTARNADTDYRAIYSFKKDRELYEKWEVKLILPFTKEIDSGAAEFFEKT